jgi:hypothetical protein
MGSMSKLDQDTQLESLKPLRKLGMKVVDASLLYTRCNEDIELALLVVYLTRFYSSMLKRIDEVAAPGRSWQQVSEEQSGLRPMNLLSQPDHLRSALTMLDRQLTVVIPSTVSSNPDDDVMATSEIGRVDPARLPNQREWAKITGMEGIFEGDKELDGEIKAGRMEEHIKQTTDRYKSLFMEMDDRWATPAMTALATADDPYPAIDKVVDWILGRAPVEDLLRFEYSFWSYGPIKLWRRFFELRDEPVPEEREDLLQEEEQLINQERLRAAERGQ